MLLQDVFILNNLKILNEGKGNTRMKISGCFQRADEANNNKRIYPKKVLEGAVKTLQTPIGERMLVGELDHPEYDVVKLSNASHLITNLRMQGGEVIGEAEILSTPAGQAVRNLINDGVKVGISSRGMGSLQDNPDGTRTVNEDYKCLTFDIVADPSTRGAFPGLTESTKIRDIVETTINEASREKIFVQLLKDRLEEEGSMPDESPASPYFSTTPKGARKDMDRQKRLRDLIARQTAERKAAAAEREAAAKKPTQTEAKKPRPPWMGPGPSEEGFPPPGERAASTSEYRQDAPGSPRTPRSKPTAKPAGPAGPAATRRQRSSTNYKELYGPSVEGIIEKRLTASVSEATVKLVIKNLTTKHRKPTDAPKRYEKKAGRPKFKLGSQI